MDKQAIKNMVDNAVAQAKREYGHHHHHSANFTFGGMEQDQLMYILAFVVAIVSFFLLKHYSPDFVTSMQQGKKQFDCFKAGVLSIIFGLIILVLNYFLKRR